MGLIRCRAFLASFILDSSFTALCPSRSAGLSARHLVTLSSSSSEPAFEPLKEKMTAPTLNFSVDVYPYETPDKDLGGYSSVKTVHFLRHAEGTHNVNKEYRDIANLDARLTDKGKEQCRAVAKRIAKCRIGTIHHDIYTRTDLLVTSPLSRCISTILRTCKPVLAARPQTPVIAHEYIRETVNYNCDRRRPVSKVASTFPVVNFDNVPNRDNLWDSYEAELGSADGFTTHRESAQIYKVAERARVFCKWLSTRPESHVVVCSHAAFLRALVNYGHGDACHGLEQKLDDRAVKEDVPIFNYKGNSEEFAQTMRADYDNCELRSVRIAFPYVLR